jgi:hypothetical protein
VRFSGKKAPSAISRLVLALPLESAVLMPVAKHCHRRSAPQSELAGKLGQSKLGQVIELVGEPALIAIVERSLLWVDASCRIIGKHLHRQGSPRTCGTSLTSARHLRSLHPVSLPTSPILQLSCS